MNYESDLLFDEGEFIVVRKKLATLVGDREAMVLQTLQKWELQNRRTKQLDHFFEDRWWAYNTWAGWRINDFPFWSVPTIRRLFWSLEKANLILSKPHENKNKGAWAALNRDRLKEVYSVDEASRLAMPSKRRKPKQADPMDQTSKTSETAPGLIQWIRGSDPLDQPTGDPYKTQSKVIPAVAKIATAKPSKTPKKKTPAKPAVTPKPKTVKAPANADVDQTLLGDVIKSWIDGLPKPPAVNVYQNKGIRGNAADILRAGYTPGDITRFMGSLKQDKFWRGKFIKLSKVAEDMPSWLETHPATTAHAPAASSTPGGAGQQDLMADMLAGG